MLRLVPGFKQMIPEKRGGNPSPMHQEALLAQEGVAWSFRADVFPVLVAGNVVIANVQIEEGAC